MNDAAYVAILKRLGIEPDAPPATPPSETLASRVATLTARPGLAAGSSRYAYPWPDALAGLGVRRVGPFDQCVDCERWSWARYGTTVLCLACVRRRLGESPA